MASPLNETEYRARIQEVFDRIERQMQDVDPDLADFDQALGSFTITFGDGSRCILSAQPSVRQLWLAIASLGMAYHFNFQSDTQTWVDDKGKNIELLRFLGDYLSQKIGKSLNLTQKL